MNIKAIQQKLKDAGFYEGEIDGIWGNMSEAAIDLLIAESKNHECNATDNTKPVSGYQLSQRSLDKLDGVHPDLVKVVKRAIQITDVDFTVLEGVRTIAKQRQYVRSGASKTMNSRHLKGRMYGHAVDLGAIGSDGKVSWAWPLYNEIAVAMKQAAKELGVDIEWGGDWRSFVDGPHYQLPWAKYPK